MKSDENGYWYGKSGQRPLLHKSGDRARKRGDTAIQMVSKSHETDGYVPAL